MPNIQSCAGPLEPLPMVRGRLWFGTRHGESGETDIPPQPKQNLPLGSVVSSGRTPSWRFADPTVGKPPWVGVIARKYSQLRIGVADTKP